MYVSYCPELDIVSCGEDVQQAKKNLNYCEHGLREGRNPSALFDTMYYLEVNSDIRNAGINPLFSPTAWGRSSKHMRRVIL